jgi:type VI secretion system protein ImpG
MQASGREDFLEYYKRELTYLREMGAIFSRQYPKIAARLELGRDQAADPQVERLLESFAFLTARIQHQLDSEFPEIPSALLGVLYPHLLNPVPSMAIAQFEVDPTQGQLTSGYEIPPHTPLFAQTSEGLTCRFRTCYPVTLWPIEVAYAGFESTDQFDFLDAVAQVATVLRIRLQVRGAAFRELSMRRLRFHLHGEQAVVHELYQLLFCHVVGLVLLPDNEQRPVWLPKEAIAPVGFEPEEAALPYPRQAHPGYRLLQEYFAFPEKFLFVDVSHLDRQHADSACDLLMLLTELPRAHAVVTRQTFRLGCTPIINLFRKTTEPIRLDHRQTEYRLIPDMRRERTTEIHSILSVSASSDAAEETTSFEPFYSFHHRLAAKHHQAFWHARRVPTERQDLPGTAVYLSFLDLDFQPSLPPVQTVFAHTLCTNRRLAEQLPAGARLQIEEAAPLAWIAGLGKPTPQLDPPLRGATLWRLVSHLALNHLSLDDGPDALPALREILRLYCVADQASDHQQIMGITDMVCRRVVRRLGPEAWRGFCRGTEVTLTFDEAMYAGSSPLLFAAVLHRFFALYASVNTFTQLHMKTRQREEIRQQWPPMAGAQIVL